VTEELFGAADFAEISLEGDETDMVRFLSQTSL
jgi:hypothetical protein